MQMVSPHRRHWLEIVARKINTPSNSYLLWILIAISGSFESLIFFSVGILCAYVCSPLVTKTKTKPIYFQF